MKTFVTDISASTGRNDFIFDVWLLHGELYRVYPFQVYRTSTSCLPCDLDFCNRYLGFYWKKWFYIWYMAFAWWLVPCLPFPGLPHIYFLFTVWLRIFHVCRNENFRNSYLSFYWKKWFYIWYMAFAWWLVPCLPRSRFTAHLLQIYTNLTQMNEWGYS